MKEEKEMSMEEYGVEVVRKDEHTWILENQGVRLFLLEGREKALLIDAGMRLRHARDVAARLTDLPLELLNTHADMDHIGSNPQFESFYMHPAEESAYREHGTGGRILPVTDGDVLELGDRPLEIIHLPGHTPGSIGVLDRKARVLISGDPIQEHGRIFMFGEHRNMRDYITSMERLETMKDRFDEIWPSHGDLPVPPERIGQLIQGAREVMDGRIPGKSVDLFGKQVTAFDLGFCTLLCDPVT